MKFSLLISVVLLLCTYTIAVHSEATSVVSIRFSNQVNTDGKVHDVDVFVNDEPAITNVAFGSITQYRSYPNIGTSIVNVTIQHSEDNNIIYTGQQAVVDQETFTFVLMGIVNSTESPVSLISYSDDISAAPDNKCRIRFINAVPTTNANVFYQDNVKKALLFSNPIGYKSAGNPEYVEYPAGSVNIIAEEYPTNDSLSSDAQQECKSKEVYTYIMGGKMNGAPIQINRATDFENVAKTVIFVRLMHAIAGLGNITKAVMTQGGVDRTVSVWENIPYTKVTPYNSFDSGTFTITLTVDGLTDPVVTTSIDNTADTYHTLALVGLSDGSVVPSISPVEDDSAPVSNATLSKVRVFNSGDDTISANGAGGSWLGLARFGAGNSIYQEIPAGTFEMTYTDSDDAVIGSQTYTVKAGDVYTIFVFGNYSNKASLATSLQLDQDYAPPPPVITGDSKIRFSYAIPAGAVDLLIDGHKYFVDIAYGTTTSYSTVSYSGEGNHHFEVVEQGTNTTVVEAYFKAEVDNEYLILATSQSNAAKLFSYNDATVISETKARIRFINGAGTAEDVTFKVNGNAIGSVAYGQSTGYSDYDSDGLSFAIEAVYQTNVVAYYTLPFAEKTVYTLILEGDPTSNFTFAVLPDFVNGTVVIPTEDTGSVRFFNALQDKAYSEVQVFLSRVNDADLKIATISYADPELKVLKVPSGYHELIFKDSTGNSIFASSFLVKVRTHYTICIVGGNGEPFTLKSYDDILNKRPDAGTSLVRGIDVALGTAPINVYGSNNLLWQGLQPLSAGSPYYKPIGATSNVTISLSSAPTDTIAEKDYEFFDGEVSTIIVYGKDGDADFPLDLVIVYDTSFAPAVQTKVRVFNGVKGLSDADVFISSTEPMFSSVDFEDITSYSNVTSGSHTISVKSSAGIQLASTSFTFSQAPYTLVLFGDTNDKSGFAITIGGDVDNLEAPHNNGLLRMWHLIPGLQFVNIWNKGTVKFAALEYGRSSNPSYASLAPGTYSFVATTVLTNKTINEFKIKISDGAIKTAFLVGTYNSTGSDASIVETNDGVVVTSSSSSSSSGLPAWGIVLIVFGCLIVVVALALLAGVGFMFVRKQQGVADGKIYESIE